MRVEKAGEGEPEYVVTAMVHGDEPCGREAVERFLASGIEVMEPVRFVVANEEAARENVRFLDTDLNRSFPGNPDSESHEERLAAEIMPEIEGKKVLDIHSTRSHPGPFATLTYLNRSTWELCRAAGIENIVHFPEEGVGTLHEQVEAGVVLEVGYQGTAEAADRAYSALLNFLAAGGIIDREFELSRPDVFRYYETVEGGDYEFVAENFEKVEEGEVFARRNGEELVAEEDFYPVLMSTHGYEDILGYRASKVEGPELESYIG